MRGEVPQIRSNAAWMLALFSGSQLPRYPKCFQDAIEIKTPKHSLWISRSEQKGAKVLLSSRNFIETCLDNSKRLRMTKTSNERAVFTDMDPRTHLGASKAKAKKPTLASEISEAPHHVQKISPDELSRSLQSPNFPQNRPSKPPK